MPQRNTSQIISQICSNGRGLVSRGTKIKLLGKGSNIKKNDGNLKIIDINNKVPNSYDKLPNVNKSPATFRDHTKDGTYQTSS